MTNGYPPQGWYADPTYRGGARYWNGVSRTEVVSRGRTPTTKSPAEGG